MELSGLFNDSLEEDFRFYDATIRIRHLSNEVSQAIVMQAIDTKFVRHQPVEKYNNLKLHQLIAIEAIVSWSGFKVNGEPFECTDDNKKKLATKSSEFAKFVFDRCSKLGEFVYSQEDDTVKKS